MKRNVLKMLGIAMLISPAVAYSQSGSTSKAATYITAEEVKKVHETPGVDRTITVLDIGHEHFSVGTIHRGKTGAPAAAAAGAARGAAGAAGGAAAARGNAPAPEPCGERSSTPPTPGGPSGISHDMQTEGYLITGGAGTMVTGGHIVNGRKSGPNDEVTTTLNGPSCSGAIGGSDVVTRDVKVGDIIIIPAGTPHGWTNIPDHVDYLSFRPSQTALTAGYVNPAIKK